MTSDLSGQGEQEAAFLAAYRDARLHHAWLLTGPRGLGKGSFARNAARFLVTRASLTPNPTEPLSHSGDPALAALAAAGNHPELHVLERLPHKDADKPRARSIVIDQVRALMPRMSMSIGLGHWRVVIVDAIDDLERQGANALLKLLEEPPARTIFFLVSHVPGRLLPTIRSRCRTLRFNAWGEADMLDWLKSQRPHDDIRSLGVLQRLAGGNPGIARQLLDHGAVGGGALLLAIAEDGDPEGIKRLQLAQQLAPAAARPQYEAMLRHAPSTFASLARQRGPAQLGDALDTWPSLEQLCAEAVAESADPTATCLSVGSMFASLA